jgi:hypothetical protein
MKPLVLSEIDGNCPAVASVLGPSLLKDELDGPSSRGPVRPFAERPEWTEEGRRLGASTASGQAESVQEN